MEVSQEGEGYPPGSMRRPANVDLEACLGRRMAAVHRCERDPDAQTRRHRATRHMPDVDSTGKDAVPRPWDAPVVHPHTYEPRIVVARALHLEGLAADEGSAPLDDPGAVHLERRLVSVEVLPGQKIALFQAKRVPRPEADRLDPEVRPGFQERLPDPQSLGRCRKELESRLSCVPRSCDEKRGPSTGNGGVPCGRDGDAW